MLVTASYLRTFSVLLLSCVICTHAYNKYITAFHRHFDRRVRCGILKTLGTDPYTCRKTCAETAKCFSVNIYTNSVGSTICELVKGSTDTLYNKDCVEWNSGRENSEFEYRQTCSADQKECSPKYYKKVLPDGWYQLGTTAYKLFTEHLKWYKAVTACAEKGAAIAQIKNKDENEFVTLLLEDKPRKEKKLPSTIRPVGHWKLDGTDKDVELFGDASIQKDQDQVTNVLHLPSTKLSYAETPSYDIRSTGFTVCFWAKLQPGGGGYVYSRWGSPYHFGVGVYRRFFVMNIKREYKTKPEIFIVPAYRNRWAHYTAVWNRANATAILYLNGNQVHKVQYQEIYTKIVPNSLSSKFDVGLRRNSSQSLVGSLSQLYLFDRVLSSEELEIVRDSFYMGNSAWIGLNDIATEGRYMTDDAQVASYMNLAPRQTDQDVQDCVSMRAWDEGMMDSNHCNYTVLPYICMKRV